MNLKPFHVGSEIFMSHASSQHCKEAMEYVFLKVQDPGLEAKAAQLLTTTTKWYRSSIRTIA